MICDDLKLELDDYLDGLLEDARHAAVQDHLENCHQCRQLLQREQAFRQDLRDLPVPPARPGYAARAVDKARAGTRIFHGHSFVAGFSSAIAAGVAIWVISILFLAGPVEPPQDSLQTVSIVLFETQKVKLAFDSPRELGNARVSLLLPEHVELDGFPGQREISWQTDLRQGRNILSLPIRATQLSQGTMEARIEHQGKSRVIRINLQAGKAGLSGPGMDLGRMV